MTTKPDRPKRKMRGGSPLGIDWENNAREKISNSATLNRLINYVEGRISLETGQVAAALGLLRKVLPDLSYNETKAEITHRSVVRVPEKAISTETWQQEHDPAPTIQ